MRQRASPLSAMLMFLFGVPFLVVGGAMMVAALVASGWQFFPIGAFHVLVGGIVFREGLRELRSPESLALRRGAVVSGRSPAASRAAYRVNAAPVAQTAREAYGAALRELPLPRLDLRRGAQLSYRLARRDAKSTWGSLAFAVVWSAFTFPLFVGAVVNVSALSFFLLPFAAAGCGLLYGATKRLLAARRLVQVEMSDEPVYLGDTLTVRVVQRGPATVVRLTAALVCQERVRYRAGKSYRIDTHEAYRHELLDEIGLRVARGETWTRDVAVQLPLGPPSFHGAFNEVAWTLVFRAELDGWPDYTESFVFRAVPRLPS